MRIVFTFVLVAIVAGCAHETYVVDSKHPEIEYSENGDLKWHGRFIEPDELPGLLEKSGVSKKSQIDIRVPERIHSLKGPRHLLFIMRKAGYTRGVLMTEKRAYSGTSAPPSKSSPKQRIPPHQPRRVIRYK